MHYGGLLHSKGETINDRPAGSYKYNDPKYIDVYFNIIIDPESTRPADDTAGICARGMIN